MEEIIGWFNRIYVLLDDETLVDHYIGPNFWSFRVGGILWDIRSYE